MQRSKLFRILHGFAETDWKECDKFLLMLHSRSTDLYRLYKYISKYRDDLDSKKLNIDVAHHKLERELPRKSFQNIMSRLLKEIEQYFIWEQVKSNKKEADHKLLEAYNKRGLFKEFDKLADSVRKNIRTDHTLDMWKDFDLLQLNFLQFFSENPVKYESGEELLTSSTKHLTDFSSKLEMFIEAIQYHFGNIINKDLVGQAKSINHEKSRTTIWIEALLQATKNRDLTSYRNLRDLVLTTEDKVDRNLYSYVLGCLVNLATVMIASAEDVDPQDLLKVHMIGLEEGYYTLNGKLPSMRFFNIVNVAASCNEFELAENIIETYSSYILESEKEQIIALAKSEIELYRGNYEEAIELIRDRAFSRISMSLCQRITLLKSLFMIYRDDLDFLDMTVKNYNAFIHNNKKKISQKNYHACLNLSRVIKMMYRGHGKEKIRSVLNSKEYIYSRVWLKSML